ncbi:MAG: gamma-glutamylcyclotransferase [Polyangiaceae bacterium]|nr:gamma-glutamylcyclotransferase [Polyangiaceae bacterium]
MGDPPRDHFLFAYGSLRVGEIDHHHLAEAELLGPIRTPPAYHLVELRQYPALVPGGRLEVVGELYRVPRAVLLRIDVVKEVPRLFNRVSILLAGGTTAEAYTMRLDQVPGMRRLRHGDWRERFVSPWSRASVHHRGRSLR